MGETSSRRNDRVMKKQFLASLLKRKGKQEDSACQANNSSENNFYLYKGNATTKRGNTNIRNVRPRKPRNSEPKYS